MRGRLSVFTLVFGLVTVGAGLSRPAVRLQADPTSTKEGRRLFQQKCAVCHVRTSSIARQYAPPLSGRLVTGNEVRIRESIIEGKGRMPGWKYTLQAGQIDDVIAYLKTLEQPPQTIAMSPEDIGAAALPAASTNDGRLIGAVRSSAGKNMEGVAILARMDGRTVTTTVFTDAEGRYEFPPMQRGSYEVWAQAAGYQKGQGRVVLEHGVAHQDFVIKETKDFFPQLTGADLVAALPEDTPAHRRMKFAFVRNCTECHAANIALQNRFDARGWEGIVEAMNRLGPYGGFSAEPDEELSELSYFKRDLAAYLTEIRGPGPSPMQLKVPARPTGDAALAVVYEYDLPLAPGGGYVLNNGSDWSLGPSMASGGGLGIHDAQVDFDGNLWATTQGVSATRTIARIDAKTGDVTDLTYPAANGRAARTHGIAIARDGVIWFDVDAGPVSPDDPTVTRRLGRIDPKIGKMEVFTPPNGMAGARQHVDDDGLGAIWASGGRATKFVTETGAIRFDPRTREFKEFKSVTAPGSTYGVAGDRYGNGWWTQDALDIIGYSDIKTGKSLEMNVLPADRRTGNSNTFLKPGDLSPEDIQAMGPRGPGHQFPRRPAADKDGDDVWVPNFVGNSLMRINVRTRKATYYPAPRVGLNPYMTAVDKNHIVWMSLQGSDEVARFDPKTETWTFYAWPTRATGLRDFHLADHGGVLQLSGAYFNANRAARMVIRKR